MWFLALFSFVLSVVLLGLSIFPGPLEQVPVGIVRYVGGAFWLFAIAVVFRHLLRSSQPGQVRQRRSALVALFFLVATPLLLLTDSPRRLMFRQNQAKFEALLAEAPPADRRAVVPINADLSVYWIDHWGTDLRGGTYFRTMSGPIDGRAERRSFGFAYQPNAEGSPFGDARYEVQHLTGDWYSFTATDDR